MIICLEVRTTVEFKGFSAAKETREIYKIYDGLVNYNFNFVNSVYNTN